MKKTKYWVTLVGTLHKRTNEKMNLWGDPATNCGVPLFVEDQWCPPHMADKELERCPPKSKYRRCKHCFPGG